MNIDDMIKEVRELRDEGKCTDDHCLCERYDRIIDALEAQRKAIWDLLTMVADPKHSEEVYNLTRANDTAWALLEVAGEEE
tara:strand:+ start:171 stop:413 length:243 start_codon:yes stop_codon:yes gene_type:complete